MTSLGNAVSTTAALAWCRRIPRLTINIFGRSWGSWSISAYLGALSGLAIWMSLSVPSLGTGLAIGVAIANIASFYALATLACLVSHRRNLILIHHLVAAVFVTTMISFALDAPTFGVLDYWVIGFLPVLIGGRVGCFLVGCCHGRVARYGTWYSWRALGPLRRTAGEVLSVVPVQAFEAMGLLLLAGLACVLLAVAAPGTSFVVAIGGYAVLRFGTECFRGDPRPHLGRFSEAQVEALIVVVAIGATGLITGSFVALVVGGSAISALAGMLVLCWRGLGPPVVYIFRESSLEHLRDAFVEAVRTETPTRAPRVHFQPEHGCRVRVLRSDGAQFDRESVEILARLLGALSGLELNAEGDAIEVPAKPETMA